MCVLVCQATTGDAFSMTTLPLGIGDGPGPNGAATANAATFAATLSAVGTTFVDASTLAPPPASTTIATCLYDFLLIAGGRDTNGVQADRYCGNALNPAPLPLAAATANALPSAVALPLTLTVPTPGGLPTSTQVCSKLKKGFSFFLYTAINFLFFFVMMIIITVPSGHLRRPTKLTVQKRRLLLSMRHRFPLWQQVIMPILDSASTTRKQFRRSSVIEETLRRLS
jgi:hypothetical protein